VFVFCICVLFLELAVCFVAPRLCCDLDALPEGLTEEATSEERARTLLIDAYEREIHAFHEVLIDEWTPEKVGLVLSMSGRQLVNWPLHCMSVHVPDQVRMHTPRRVLL
jgi:hypothetical protein